MRAFWVWAVIAAAGCYEGGEGGAGDADGDADVGSDADTDSDSDSNSDPGSGDCGTAMSPDGRVAGMEVCPTPRFPDVYRFGGAECQVNDADACAWEDGECRVDADCPDGFSCGTHVGEWGCSCVAPCALDDDCAADEACLCRVGELSDEPVRWTHPLTECIPSSCRFQTDCGDGRCALSFGDCYRPEGFHCRDASSGCDSNADCEGNERCWFDATAGDWSCRPFAECE